MDATFNGAQDAPRPMAPDYRYHPYPNSQRRHDQYGERMSYQAPLYSQPHTPGPMHAGGSNDQSTAWSPMSDEQQVSRPPRSYHGRWDGPSAEMAPMEVEVLASRLKLNPAARAALHDFTDLSVPAQMATLFAHVLETRQGQADIAERVDKTGQKVEELQKMHVAAFSPSVAATKHMRRMSRHFVIQPLHDYLLVHTATQNYYMRKPHTFQIPTYATDENVRSIIDACLLKYGAQARSNYRKVVWKFVGQGASLDIWATFIMRHYYFHGSAAAPEASTMIKARIALIRQVALPLVALPTVKGQSTMLWTKTRSALVKLYKKYGPDIESVAWKQWAEQIVAADVAAYTARSIDLPDPECVPDDPPTPDTNSAGPPAESASGGAEAVASGAAGSASGTTAGASGAASGTATGGPASGGVGGSAASNAAALDPDDDVAMIM